MRIITVRFRNVRKVGSVEVGQRVVDVAVQCVIRTVLDLVHEPRYKIRRKSNNKTLKRKQIIQMGVRDGFCH